MGGHRIEFLPFCQAPACRIATDTYGALRDLSVQRWNAVSPTARTRDTTFMSLLRDIQVSATDPGQSVSDLLRKCQMLAYHLRHEPLKTWVPYELSGYSSGADLPEYLRTLDGR